MARHKVEICGVNTANIQVLSNEEMLDLFNKYKNGDDKARELLINGNLKGGGLTNDAILTLPQSLQLSLKNQIPPICFLLQLP